MVIKSQCAMCGKHLEFANLLEYDEACKKSGAELTCESCQQEEGGGPEEE